MRAEKNVIKYLFSCYRFSYNIVRNVRISRGRGRDRRLKIRVKKILNKMRVGNIVCVLYINLILLVVLPYSCHLK